MQIIRMLSWMINEYCFQWMNYWSSLLIALPPGKAQSPQARQRTKYGMPNTSTTPLSIQTLERKCFCLDACQPRFLATWPSLAAWWPSTGKCRLPLCLTAVADHLAFPLGQRLRSSSGSGLTSLLTPSWITPIVAEILPFLPSESLSG